MGTRRWPVTVSTTLAHPYQQIVRTRSWTDSRTVKASLRATGIPQGTSVSRTAPKEIRLPDDVAHPWQRNVIRLMPPPTSLIVNRATSCRQNRPPDGFSTGGVSRRVGSTVVAPPVRDPQPPSTPLAPWSLVTPRYVFIRTIDSRGPLAVIQLSCNEDRVIALWTQYLDVGATTRLGPVY